MPSAISSMSIGSDDDMMLDTGCWESSEWPKSPCTAPEAQRQYCSGYEPVRPSCFFAASSSAGVAVLSPAKKRSRMLPGRRRTARKMMIEIATIVATRAANLSAMKRCMDPGS